ncbi:hypothetical protein [Chryseobacterium indologenes]|uniref:hypothetical protein n=1 Tax=Chryseobacterium indologenes TaxID=253 RepID=UPI00301AC58C
MELKTFISDVLNDVAEGISNSKEKYKELGGFVSPEFKSPTGIKRSLEVYNDHYKEISTIEFEINLTNEEKAGNASGIGVMLGSINLGAKKDSNSSENIATRIKFSVPVIFP